MPIEMILRYIFIKLWPWKHTSRKHKPAHLYRKAVNKNVTVYTAWSDKKLKNTCAYLIISIYISVYAIIIPINFYISKKKKQLNGYHMHRKSNKIWNFKFMVKFDKLQVRCCQTRSHNCEVPVVIICSTISIQN